MTTTLDALIREASTELGSTACQTGRHQWSTEGEGGRGCPHDLTDHCGQGVYRCTVCGQYDYGERGGPGDADCERCCPHRDERAQAIAASRIDPLRHLWNSHPRINHFLRLRALRRQRKPNLP